MTYGADPDAMARPASITATKGTTTYWSTGAYGYDGAGNVTAIGDSYFLYDPVSRLTTGTVSTSSLGTGSLKTQSYTYDAFGNIQSIAGSPGRSTPTSSVTNRLTGTAVYDASGNLTSWNGNAYEYDALNMMTRMTSGAEDWLYVYTADDERVWQYKLTSGSPFHRYTLRDLSGQVLREYTSAGDSWTVERDYVVVEPADELARQASRDLLVADVATAQEVLGRVGRLSRVDLVLDSPDDAERLRVPCRRASS